MKYVLLLLEHSHTHTEIRPFFSLHLISLPTDGNYDEMMIMVVVVVVAATLMALVVMVMETHCERQQITERTNRVVLAGWLAVAMPMTG